MMATIDFRLKQRDELKEAEPLLERMATSATSFQILASFGLESSAFCCYTCAALLCLLSIARFP